MKEPHIHKFDTPAEKKVLLAQYRSEDGKVAYVGTTGADIIKLRVCACGKSYAYDLERVVR